MSLRTVVEDDLLRLRRSPLGWGVALSVLAPTAGIAAIMVLLELVDVTGGPAAPFDNIMMTVAVLLSFLLPFVAMLGSYSAIVYERESGSVRFLLGLPNSRWDAYAGKYVSRTVLLVVSILAGFLTLALVGFGILTDPSASGLLLFVLATAQVAVEFAGLLENAYLLGFGLIIALSFVKALVVAGYYQHLVWEPRSISYLMGIGLLAVLALTFAASYSIT